jgi:uncharacterized protein YceH (UPF0502 family)
LHRFADGSAIEAFLHELRDRNSGALVTELPRQPGARENRWMHLLSGEPAPESASSRVEPDPAAGGIAVEIASLKDDVARLERELGMLRQEIASLRAESDGKR